MRTASAVRVVNAIRVACVARMVGASVARTVGLGTLTAASLALVFWPVQRSWMSWGVATRNQVERTALALRLGIDDPATTPPPADLGALAFDRCVAAVRGARMQMFAENDVPALGATLLGGAAPPDLPSLSPSLQPVAGLPNMQHAAVDLPPALLPAAGQEWPIVDADGVVVGRLRADEGRPLWRRLPQPLVSRRGNLYLLTTAARQSCRVVTATAPFLPLVVLTR